MTGIKNYARESARGGLTLVRELRPPGPVSSQSRETKAFFLRTRRLGFRIWSRRDLSLAIGLWGDPDVTRFIDTRERLSGADAKRLLESQVEMQRQHGVQYWPLFLLATGEHVGCCGLRLHDAAHAIYELSVQLRPAFWGSGLAEEAALAVMPYAFHELGASALFASHHPANRAARRLLEKLGFQYTHTQFFRATGLDHPSYIRTRGMAPLRFRQEFTAVSA